MGGNEDGEEEGEELEKEREGGRRMEGGKSKKRVRRERGDCKEKGAIVIAKPNRLALIAG